MPGAPVVSDNSRDKLEAIRPSPEGEPVQATVDWVTLYHSRHHPAHEWTVGCAGCFGVLV